MKILPPLAAILVSGCAAFGNPKPVIENRFAALDPEGAAVPGTIRISVSTGDVADPPGGIPIVALSDRAQAALIVATSGKPPAKVGRAAPQPPGAVEMRDEVSRHFDIALRPTAFLPPGDRVDAIRVALRVAPTYAAKWKITGWTQANNGTKVIEIGKITDTAESKLSASTGLKIAGFLPDATISGESSRNVAREATLRDTSDFDAAVDNDGSAWLDETGGWRDNLAHSLAMDVTVSALAGVVSVPRHHVVTSDLRTEDGSSVPAAKVQLSNVTFYEPTGSEQPICGVAELTYRVRHIVAGGATTTEADDRISFRTGTARTGFLLSPAPYRPLYVLASGGQLLNYVMTGGSPGGLEFATLEDATAFRNWLQAIKGAGTLSNAKIGIAAASGALRALSAAELARLVPTLSPTAFALRSQRSDTSSCALPTSQGAQ